MNRLVGRYAHHDHRVTSSSSFQTVRRPLGLAVGLVTTWLAIVIRLVATIRLLDLR